MLLDYPTPGQVIHQADEYGKRGLLPGYLLGSEEFVEVHERFRSLMARNNEIRALYAKIGYSFDIERQAVDEKIVRLLVAPVTQGHPACESLGYYETIWQKKRQLDGVLWDLWSERIGLNNPVHPYHHHFRSTAQERAKEYLDASWMHTPWLMTYVLTNLLDAYFALLTREIWPEPLPPLKWREISSWLLFLLFGVYILLPQVVFWCFFHPFQYLQLRSIVRMLRIIREEVVSGLYDGKETARRLRRFEKKGGITFSSLIYSLLRLSTSASPSSVGPV